MKNHIAAFAQERSVQLPLRTMTMTGIEGPLHEFDGNNSNKMQICRDRSTKTLIEIIRRSGIQAFTLMQKDDLEFVLNA